MRECLEEGVDVNVQDEDGVSAAMIVMKNKNIHVLKLLSEVDSLDWNLEDVEGNTVASWYSLIYSGDVFDEAFNELKNIESIDWNHQNKEGCTVSLRAAYYTNVECLKMLSQKKNQTEVTSVKLVFFKYMMSFETWTKVDQLKEIIRIG